MTDIDFDELDRAVQSLTSPSDTTPAGSNQVDEQPVVDSSGSDSSTVSSTGDAITAQVQPSSARTDNQSATTAPSASSTIIPPRRPSGRFMDVVHPSSDMRSRQPVKRQGLNIEPSTDLATEVQSSDVAPQESGIKDNVQSAAEHVQSPDSLESHASTSHDSTEMTMPDPIDFLSQKDTTPTPETDSPAEVAPEMRDEVELDSVVSDDVQGDVLEYNHDDSISSIDETSQPLETPFISNPKVEKRPLGTPATETTPNDTLDNEDSSGEVAIETPLPAELHQDVLALESDETVGDIAHVDTGNVSHSEVSSPPSTKVDERLKTSPSSDEAPEADTDHQPGAIYDTKSYHQPLQHPTKKHTGWLVVLWILLLIAVGAGVGAALYFFVLT